VSWVFEQIVGGFWIRGIQKIDNQRGVDISNRWMIVVKKGLECKNDVIIEEENIVYNIILY
jgi:hypothetical protein